MPTATNTPAPAKVQTVEEALAILRKHADDHNLYLARGFIYPGRPLKPMQRKILDAKLTATCTAIELLTVNGNFNRERGESLERVIGSDELSLRRKMGEDRP